MTGSIVSGTCEAGRQKFLIIHQNDEGKLQRLEIELDCFYREIQQRETENKQLQEQIADLKSQTEESQRRLAEIPTVADQHMTTKEIMTSQKLANKMETREKEISQLRCELKKQVCSLVACDCQIFLGHLPNP